MKIMLLHGLHKHCPPILVIAKSSRLWILLSFSVLLTYLFITVLEFQRHVQLMEGELGQRVEMIPPQDDPWLIQFVKKHYILSPNLSQEYNLTKGESNPDQSEGQVNAMKGFFEGQKSGFFIECGASDGEFLSNTLWFEKVLEWNGLLIEADPNAFQRLMQRNRRAWHANVCLSPTPFPGKHSPVTVESVDVMGLAGAMR